MAKWGQGYRQITLRLTLAAVVMALAGAMLGGQTPDASQDNAFFVGPGTQDAFLNGQPLLPGTAILAGETVTTGTGGILVLTPTHGDGGVLELTGNASATVRPGAVPSGLGTDQLEIQQGDALITGNVSVITPQGETFRPAGANTSYVVNAGANQSTMGVISGAVNTYNGLAGGPSSIVPAGSAIQVSGLNGQVRIRNVNFDQVNRPSTNASIPQQAPASQSQ